MGLDMYLKGKRYLSKYFAKGDAQLQDSIQKLFPELAKYNDSPVNEVQIEAAYWRKDNHIHKWFVDNVQEGEDDCGTYHVSRNQLQELRDLCRRVLDFRHLATEQLPRQAGFFFGSTDYNESYYNACERTILQIDRALSLPDEWEFEYHSSW